MGVTAHKQSTSSSECGGAASGHAGSGHWRQRWLPQRFRYRPKVIAPALSMLRMVWLLRREVRDQDAQLIHARSSKDGPGTAVM